MGKYVDKNGNRLPMLYMVSGSIVKISDDSSVRVHSWEEIQDLFKNQYEITPSDPLKLGIAYGNGDGTAVRAHVDGFTWQDNVCFAVFDSVVNGNIRISYAYFYYQ